MRYGFVFLFLISIALGTEPPFPPKQNWSFQGLFGTFDRKQLQRGFQVYKEVCSTCHGLNLLHYRDLKNLGYSSDELSTIAASFPEIKDGPNDAGDMYDRPRRSYDRISGPYLNENAARTANSGALPPDLSLIIKARNNGADYVYAILTGYKDSPPPNVVLGPNMHYNLWFPGNQIAMPPPLSSDMVSYADGTKASVEQMAADVTTFLSWASDIHQDHRKALGFKVLMYLVFLAILFYFLMNRIWSQIKKHQ